MPDHDICELITGLTLPIWAGSPDARNGPARAAPADHWICLAERSRSGDRAADAALRLLHGLGGGDSADVHYAAPTGSNLAVHHPDADSYATARRSFESGDVRSATIGLCELLARSDTACELPLALAVCALRLQKLEEARDLALASLACNPRHPRALCILGLCDLMRGGKVEAQGRLALAARLARGQPEYREDMRTAQRLLLIRHFG